MGHLNTPRFRIDPISDSFVRLIDIIFGVILAQGFVIYRGAITNPSISIEDGSLVLVYATIILSWIGYHKSVIGYPYNMSPWSRIRLTADILILVLYSYLVFVAQSLTPVLGGLVVVFVVYAITGLVRIIEWKDRKVSLPWLSLIFAGLFTVELYLSASHPDVSASTILLFLAFATLLLYRGARGKFGYPLIIPVGIDVDGVLGDQVPPALMRIQQRKKIGIGYTKERITNWNQPIDGSSIDKEIEEALLDPEFVREMPLVPGSTAAMSELHKKFHIVISTSRPLETESETIKWLRRNFPKSFHEFVNTRLFGKETLGLKILVDDYSNNIRRFASAGGIGLLFSQPWNIAEDDELREQIRAGKVIRCNGWDAVKDTLQKLAQRPLA